MNTPPRHVSILAGGGDLPLQIASSVVRRGRSVHIVAIAGAAGPEVEAYPHTWVNMAQAARMFSALHAPDGTDGVMVIAGAVTRPDIATLRPDFGIVRVLMQVLGLITAGGDDALLTRAIRIFEREGLTVVGVQDVAPELLIGEGLLGAHGLDPPASEDVARGHAVLAALGGLDVGQAIVVEGGRVLAIEGVEGTDRMLGRVADLGAARGQAVLLKAPKPQQERRVDLPTIGLRTVERAHAAGCRGVAVVADAAIGLQREAMIAEADRLGMFVAGVTAPGSAPLHPMQPTLYPAGRRVATPRDLADAVWGTDALWRLAPFNTGSAAMVVRGHVIGIAAVEEPAGLLARAAGLSQWGLKRFAVRRGVVALRLGRAFRAADAAFLVPRIAEAGFAGVAATASIAHDVNELAAAADRAGLFVVRSTPPSEG